MTRLSDLTTLRLGGPAARVVTATTTEQFVDAVRVGRRRRASPFWSSAAAAISWSPTRAGPGWSSSSAPTASSASETSTSPCRPAWCGTSWSRQSVREGWSGLASMSGIPGLHRRDAGAERRRVRHRGGRHDRPAARATTAGRARSSDWDPQRCGFGFRTSAFKHTDRYVVLEVTFALPMSPRRAARPLPRGRPPPRRRAGRRAFRRPNVRDVVLELRRSKGMLLDADRSRHVERRLVLRQPVRRPGPGPGRLPATGSSTARSSCRPRG